VGIGAGIIQDGQPMLGIAGYAGEAGHTLINPNGKECSCGSRGCWETEAGEAALAERAGLVDLVGQRLIEEITYRVEIRDPQALQALETTGAWLGYGIGNLINVFNRSEEHTSELQSRENLVCRLLLEKKKKLNICYCLTRQID